MADSGEGRNYTFSDGTLIQKTDSLIQSVKRDATDFVTRGITPATIDNLDNMRDDFDDFPTDLELLGLQTDATEKKLAAEEKLKAAIRVVRDIAYDKYEGKSFYKSFGFDDMDGMRDAELHRLAKRTVRVGNTLLTDLATNGLTPALLNAVTATDNDFDTALDAQAAAVENRDIAQQTRVRKGNTLYDEFARLCRIGKSLYGNGIDPAKFNDYIILFPDNEDTEEETPPVE